MQWRLGRRGYRVLGVEEWMHDPQSKQRREYDLISCLNVLDRCSRPLQLLADMRDCLAPGHGRLLLAIVLPFCPFVEEGPKQVRPAEILPLAGSSPEEHINSLAELVFRPLDLVIEAVSRAPYLCEGDLRSAYYLLHDYMFVLRRL